MKKIRLFVYEYFWIIMLGLLSIYFTYHIFFSKRGYLKLLEVEKEIEKSMLISQETQNYKEYLNHRFLLLSEKSLDADLIDEMIRKNLNMALKDEYVILK